MLLDVGFSFYSPKRCKTVSSNQTSKKSIQEPLALPKDWNISNKVTHLNGFPLLSPMAPKKRPAAAVAPKQRPASAGAAKGTKGTESAQKRARGKAWWVKCCLRWWSCYAFMFSWEAPELNLLHIRKIDCTESPCRQYLRIFCAAGVPSTSHVLGTFMGVGQNIRFLLWDDPKVVFLERLGCSPYGYAEEETYSFTKEKQDIGFNFRIWWRCPRLQWVQQKPLLSQRKSEATNRSATQRPRLMCGNWRSRSPWPVVAVRRSQCQRAARFYAEIVLFYCKVSNFFV